jgi:hypothetical protein
LPAVGADPSELVGVDLGGSAHVLEGGEILHPYPLGQFRELGVHQNSSRQDPNALSTGRTMSNWAGGPPTITVSWPDSAASEAADRGVHDRHAVIGTSTLEVGHAFNRYRRVHEDVPPGDMPSRTPPAPRTTL